MTEREYAWYAVARNEAAMEALEALLNAYGEAANYRRCEITVSGTVIQDAILLPGHHILTRIQRAGRQQEYDVYVKEGSGRCRLYTHWKQRRSSLKKTLKSSVSRQSSKRGRRSSHYCKSHGSGFCLVGCGIQKI